MIKKKVKSAVPVYLIGIVWILVGFVLPMYKLSNILIAAGLSVLAYLVSDRLIKPGEIEVGSGIQELDEMLGKGRICQEQLRRLNAEITDNEISAHITSIENITAEIFDYVIRNPKKLRRIQSFIDYYLPTTVKLLEAYSSFTKGVSTGERMYGSMENIRRTIVQAEKAFKKQSEDLYEDTVMDVSVEISVLKQMMEQDGLLKSGGV